MRPAIIALSILCAAARASAQAPDLIDADRPGLADSSTVIAKGIVQVEVGVQWESRTNSRSMFAPVLFRVGMSDRVEARVEGNTIVTVKTDGLRRLSGLSPTSLGLAFALKPAADGPIAAAVIGRVFPASGTGEFASHRVSGDARLVIDWDLADHLSINPNVGLGWYEGESGRFLAGLLALTLTYSPQPHLMWFVDSGVQSPEAEGGSTAASVDGGVAYILGENCQFDVSLGTRAFGETPPRPFVAIGFAYRHK
jgi:hypothetical protein